MNSKYSTLNQKRLKELLNYSEKTGVFTWKESRGCVKKGSIAGCAALSTGTSKYYIKLRVDKNLYYAHQLVWLYTRGVFSKYPEEETDHINGDGTDNRLCNLRIVSKEENHKNVKLQKNNKSGTCGVLFDSSRNRWRSVIKVKQKTIYLGRFKDKNDAILARWLAEDKYKFHVNHGQNR